MQNLSLFPKNFPLLRYFSTSIPKPASLNHLFIPTTNPNANPLNLVVLHGLLGSSSSFHTVLSHPKVSSLANSYLLDLRNHGASEHRDTMSAREMASDVYNFVKENNLNTNLVIMGYSMGARVAMTLCLMHPELLQGAIIVDLAPYDYNIDPRFTYMKKTRVMLEKLVKINMDSEYTVISEQVKAAARNKAIANFVMTNVRKDDESGKYRWKCNLLGILKNYDEIVGMPEGIEKEGFKGPVKIIFGEDSEFYYENVMPNFKKIFPDMDEKKDVTIIKDAVHQIHVVKPVEFVDEVSNFLKNIH